MEGGCHQHVGNRPRQLRGLSEGLEDMGLHQLLPQSPECTSLRYPWTRLDRVFQGAGTTEERGGTVSVIGERFQALLLVQKVTEERSDRNATGSRKCPLTLPLDSSGLHTAHQTT